MRIITLLLIGLLSIPTVTFSKTVPVNEAKKVAKNFYFMNAKHNLQRNYEALNLTINHIEATENAFYYVFNIEGSKGFIITSAQDFTKPILAYSDQNNVDFDNLSPELKFMLDGYKKQIEYGINNHAKANKNINAKWQNLQFPSTNRTSVVDAVGPLLLTEWNQSPYYNDLCPMDGSQRSVVGCVAVAMAQVMKYYNYPTQGEGSHYHDGIYVNYSDQTYAWENMPNSLGGENLELAKLMFHCGHTVDMNWGADGSGTQSGYICDALSDNFRYQSSTEYNRGYYSDANWELKIRTELDLLRPIVYSGFSSGSSVGHAWNCDGYQDDGEGGYLYHMNYGWAGYGNGYFALDNLIAEVVPGGDDELFDDGHQIITGIYPEANYPVNCPGTRNVTGFEGSFGDGSGYSLYENNLDCQTIIQSECARGLTAVSFDRFDIEAGDVLYLYNGTSIDDELIATFTSTNPPSGQYSSTNNGMLIRFVTNSSGRGQGWDIKYNAYVCASATYTAGSGTLTDGSGSCNYDEAANCYYYIEPVGATQITLDLTSFDLDNSSEDYLRIYDGESGSTLEIWRGDDTPPASYVVNSSKAKVRFRSYEDGHVGAGWSLDYHSDNVAINDVINFDKLVKVYPNPFNSEAYIEISNPENKSVSINITDIVGKTIANKELETFSNTKTVSLSEITNHSFKQGIYLLNIQIDNQTKTYKLIAE